MANSHVQQIFSKKLIFLLSYRYSHSFSSILNKKLRPIARRSILQNPNLFKELAYDCSKHQVQCRPKVVRKDTFWESIFGRKKKKPPKESCRLLACQKCEFEEIPCFVQTMMEDIPKSKVQRTKGAAYILEVPSLHIPHSPRTQEDEIIHRMERDKDAPFKQNLCNPMPRFSTVGARLLDLQCRKLHPLYLKYEVPPKKRRVMYKTKCDARPKLGKVIGPETDPSQNIHPKDKYVVSEFKMSDMPHSHRHRLKDYQVNLQSPLEVPRRSTAVLKKTKGFSHLKDCTSVSCTERV